jgi:SprT protein
MSVTLKNKVVTAKLENPELFKRMEERVRECFQILNAKLNKSIRPEISEPLVMFKDSRTGGYVWPTKYGNRVFLNWTLVKENPNYYINDTIPHEVCHIFQRYLYPRSSSHGIEWKTLMRMMGLRPERCHKMDTSNARRDRGLSFTYICNCQKHHLTKVKHNKFQSGLKYICKKCRKTLVFLGESS